jgi:hypothetical protein
LGEPQIIRIPDNTFEYPLHLMLNLLPWDDSRGTKTPENTIHDKTREWQAYYEMLFMNNTPSSWTLSISQTLFCQ